MPYLPSPSCSTGQQRAWGRRGSPRRRPRLRVPPGPGAPHCHDGAASFPSRVRWVKLLKQLAFTKPFYFQIITPSREVSLSAERSRVHLAVSCNVCPSAIRGLRDQETLVVLSPLSRVRLPVGRGSHGYKHLPPASLGATCPHHLSPRQLLIEAIEF